MVLYMVVVVALAIVLFLCFIIGFRYGVKLGQQASKGPLPPMKGPIKTIQEKQKARKQEKEDKELLDEFKAIMNFTGDLDDMGDKE